jgi:hypothetical protein
MLSDNIVPCQKGQKDQNGDKMRSAGTQILRLEISGIHKSLLINGARRQAAKMG